MVGAAHLAGRYQLLEKLAVGGMGAVYVAQDDKLGRRVALKLLKEELAQDANFVERFRREARAAAALSHPNVAAVFDYGEEAGTHFIVMELVQGRDLARLLREEGPLSVERAVTIASQIAQALGHAHAAGLVHRDVKPANVIVSSEDRVKVTDFGIARAAGDVTLTATGSVLGSAHYMSPEQASGEPALPASDVYALGLVLYEMLTGAVPFTGESPISVAMRHVSDPVPPPSTLRDDIPSEIDDIVTRATAKSPERRFPNGNEFARALAAAVPTAASSVPPAVDETRVLEPEEGAWPFPGHPSRWDPARLGRGVLLALAALAVIAAGLLAWRVATSDEGAAPRAESRNRGSRADAATPVVVPEDIVGMHASEAKELLERAELQVQEEEVASDAYPKEVVVDSQPAPGSEIASGSAITLFVSAGPPDEDGDEEDEGDEADEEDDSGDGPGKSEKAHGKGKAKK